MPRLLNTLISAALVSVVLLRTAAADSIKLEEPETDVRVRRVASEVRTSGTFYFNGAGGKTVSHEVEAVAAFRYRERRLPPGGRDARALRSVRELSLATAHTRVGDFDSDTEIPTDLRVIVAEGRREGVLNYCPERPMSRDAVDLLNIPGDPLTLTALLPRQAVDIGAEWSPSDWAVQMLATLEAVATSEMTCTLTSVEGRVARVEFHGQVDGQRHGANTEVAVEGHLLYDTEQRIIRSGQLKYTIKSSIGTIDPGMDATVDVTMQRELDTSPGRLTDDLASSIQLQPAPEDLALRFDASSWGITFQHDRSWYIFQAILEGNPKVVILRMLDQGSLICQCNLSPIPAAPAGQHASLDDFESDIAEALGNNLKGIVSHDEVPTGDGRKIFRFVTEGQIQVAGNAGAVEIPMQWIYYLVAAPSGKQVSAMFAIEPAYLESLAGRDVQMMQSIRFTP
jgi:hypothetical protein